MSPDDLRGALFAAEEKLGRRLDEVPRPHLVAASRDAAAPDVFHVDLDRFDAAQLAQASRPGAQHAALWLHGADLFGQRARIERLIDARTAVDPFATLDVVLCPRTPFPLDVIDLVRARLAAAPAFYLSRSLAHRGENAARRLCVVLPRELAVAPDYLEALMREVPVFRDQSLAAALREVERLGDTVPAARIVEDADDAAALAALVARAEPSAVAFADRAREQAWQRGALGFG
jgi:hypothetical protein